VSQLQMMTPLGELDIFEVYVEYDGPRVFSCKGKNDQLYFGIWAEEQPIIDVWLFVPISVSRLMAIRTGAVSFLDAILLAEGGWVWEVSTPYDGTPGSKTKRTASSLNPDHLPDPSARARHYPGTRYWDPNAAASIGLLDVAVMLGDSSFVRKTSLLPLPQQKKIDAAQTYFNRALHLFRSTQEHLGVAATLSSQGALLCRLGREPEAKDAIAEALDTYLSVGDRQAWAHTMRTYALILLAEQEIDGAFAALNQAFSIFVDFGDLLSQANTLKDIGDLCARQRKIDSAVENYSKALVSYRTVDTSSPWTGLLNSWASVVRYRRHLDRMDKAFRTRLERNLGESVETSEALAYKEYADFIVLRVEFQQAMNKAKFLEMQHHMPLPYTVHERSVEYGESFKHALSTALTQPPTPEAAAGPAVPKGAGYGSDAQIFCMRLHTITQAVSVVASLRAFEAKAFGKDK